MMLVIHLRPMISPPAPLFSIASSTEPIYLQLVDQVRRLVVGGQLAPGYVLPSVREVATDLGINPMTVSKAYGLLRSAGLVENHRGARMTVAARRSTVSSDVERVTLVRPDLERAIAKARQLGMDEDAIMSLVADIARK